jgi:hypothetical protein
VWTDERGNPEKSTRAAARYLRDLHALFGDWLLAVAAYNTGENRVAKVMHRTGIRDFWTLAERGLLAQETINYVPSVLAASQLLLRNSKPFIDAQAPKTLTEQQRGIGANVQEGASEFQERPAANNDIDNQISGLRQRIRGATGSNYHFWKKNH